MLSKISSFFKKIKSDKLFFVSFIFIILTYIVRIYIISTSTLIDDEAHYALWTKHLPFGFFDHGPGIAFFMKLGIILFGHNGFGVRIMGIITMIIVSIILYRFCKKYKNENAAVIAVLIFNTVPFFAGLALIITIDTPMFFFLILSIIVYFKAIYENKNYFYLAGAIFGFCLLSKEGAIFVGAAITFFIIFISKNKKEILLSKEFYLSFLTAALVYLPFIIYNFQTDFTFIKYALERQLQKPGSINRTLDFWSAQFLLFSPLFLTLFIYLIISYTYKFIKRKENENLMYFAFISLLPFIYILQKSFKNKLEANWALFMYGGGIFLVSFFIADNWHKKYIRKLFLANTIFCNVVIFIILLQNAYSIIPIKNDPTDRYYRYNAIRYDLKKHYDANMDKNIRIASLNYQIPSMVNFYVKPDKEAVCLNFGTYHPTVFDFWYKDSDFIGSDMYFVLPDKNEGAILNYFEEITYITNIVSYRNTLLENKKQVGEFYIYLGKNYKGNGREYIYDDGKTKF